MQNLTFSLQTRKKWAGEKKNSFPELQIKWAIKIGFFAYLSKNEFFLFPLQLPLSIYACVYAKFAHLQFQNWEEEARARFSTAV